jgi:SP family galactose:H+ symporter-like MFS transporter
VPLLKINYNAKIFLITADRRDTQSPFDLKDYMRTFFSHYYVYSISLIAALSGLLFGLDTGVISGALPIITQQFHIKNPFDQGAIISVMLLGAIFGSIGVKYFSQHLGRRFVIISSAAFFVIFSIGSALSTSAPMLIGMRFFLGIALGMASYITPIYLAEVAPRKHRGGVIAMYQLMITIGILAAFLIDQYFVSTQNWRWMLGVVAIPAGIMLVGCILLPHSPRWLMLQGKPEKAKKTLRKLTSEAEADLEFNEMQANEALMKKTKNFKQQFKSRVLALVLLGAGLQLIQQWTGINIVLYYAPEVFKSIGFHSLHDQMGCTILIGVVNVATTLLAIRYLDRWGRKPILYLGMTTMLVSLLVIATVMHLQSPHTSWQNTLAVLATMTYIFGFAISLGPVVWIVCAEIFPSAYRDFGVMITTCSNWTFNFILSQLFLPLLLTFSISKVFVGFAIVTMLGLLFVKLFVPETKDITLEEIESNLLKNKPLRLIGQP